jgi:hypothetical protein
MIYGWTTMPGRGEPPPAPGPAMGKGAPVRLTVSMSIEGVIDIGENERSLG